MITNTHKLKAFEKKMKASKPLSRVQAFYIMEELYKEALHLGNSFRKPLQGIETVIRIARAVNRV